MKIIEIKENQIFGKLSVIKELDKIKLPSGQTNRIILCKCECGNLKKIRLLHLIRNRTLSCGCLSKKRNGLGNSLLCKVWRQMKYRCKVSNYKTKVYFDKNIKVDDYFLNWENFYNWSISNGYKKGLQLDRINNLENYSPENCRFVIPKINVNNRENTFKVNYNNKIISIKLLLQKLDKEKDYHTIIGRIKRGWNHEDAINTPIKKGNYKRINQSL